MGCEAPWWCAVGASAGSWIIDSPVAQPIAATWDQERAKKAEEGDGAVHGGRCGEGVGGIGLALGCGSSVWWAVGIEDVDRVRVASRDARTHMSSLALQDSTDPVR